MTTPVDEVIVRVRAGGPRRAVSVIAMVVLGLFLLFLATTPGMAGVWRVAMVGFGMIGLWGAQATYKATSVDLVLTEEGIFDATGRELARLENIQSVDRGAFAFKPSSGFLVTLKTPIEAAWAPGAWWRVGRRLGVGGAVRGYEAKAMADAVELALNFGRGGSGRS